MKYLFLFHRNYGYTNAPQCYVMRTFPILLFFTKHYYYYYYYYYYYERTTNEDIELEMLRPWKWLKCVRSVRRETQRKEPTWKL
jgi:hypothetical protein